MSLLDVLCSPWAIIPSKLEEIQNIYMTHLRGEKINIKEVEARLGKPLDNKQTSYQIYDGVAVLPVVGVIAKRLNMFSSISGGLSTELVGMSLTLAANDPNVNSIILQIDSPGGTVDGTQALANIVRDASQVKPVVAFVDGMAASAAYWIASAAPEIYIDGDTTILGSIGVVATHVDKSRLQENMGVKTTEITAGKYKSIASEYAPLSEEGRAVIQDQVDYLYSIFVNNVAINRGVSVETVLSQMADARLFTGTQAIDAGLADGVSSLGQLIIDLSAGMQPKNNRVKVVGATTKARPKLTQSTGDVEALNQSETTPEGEAMEHTKESLIKAYPNITGEIGLENFEKGIAAGATAERERILTIEAVCMRGHEDLIAQLKADGKTTAPEAASLVIAAEKEKGGRKLQELRADAPPIINATPTATGDYKTTEVDKSLPLEKRCQAAWDKDADLRKEFSDNFNSYVAYEKANEGGLIRIKNGMPPQVSQ